MRNPNGVVDGGDDSHLSSIRSALQAWSDRYVPFVPSATCPIAVGLSGGADSVALLLMARELWPGAVIALHVNHGLQTIASDFVSFCTAVCDKYKIPIFSVSVNVSVARGCSLEAEARRIRYQTLARSASEQGAKVVLLGHHENDQAETVMLALTRGAGLPGLSAMGRISIKHGMVFGRPFLSTPAFVLKSWLNQMGVNFVDDPTNLDQTRTRNLIRHSIMPVLVQHFPAVLQTISRVANHAAQAEQLLLELAESDLFQLGNPPNLKQLQTLSQSRQANVLRYWIRQSSGFAPTSVQLEELLNQVDRCKTRGHQIAIKVSVGRVYREGPHLSYVSDPIHQAI